MNEMKCLHCGGVMINTPGKRPKKFCSTTCRSNFWQKRQRAIKATEKLSPATKAYAKSSGLLPLSYADYKKALEDAKNIEDCRLIGEKVQSASELADWQKRQIRDAAIQKSQTFDF